MLPCCCGPSDATDLDDGVLLVPASSSEPIREHEHEHRTADHRTLPGFGRRVGGGVGDVLDLLELGLDVGPGHDLIALGLSGGRGHALRVSFFTRRAPRASQTSAPPRASATITIT